MIQFKNGGVHVSTKMSRIYRPRFVLDRDGLYLNGGGLLIGIHSGSIIISAKYGFELEIHGAGWFSFLCKNESGEVKFIKKNLPFLKLWRLVCGLARQ